MHLRDNVDVDDDNDDDFIGANISPKIKFSFLALYFIDFCSTTTMIEIGDKIINFSSFAFS